MPTTNADTDDDVPVSPPVDAAVDALNALVAHRLDGHAYAAAGADAAIAADAPAPDAATACAVGRSADAVVIGTKLIQLIENEPRERVAPVAAEFLGGIRQALDSLRA